MTDDPSCHVAVERQRREFAPFNSARKECQLPTGERMGGDAGLAGTWATQTASGSVTAGTLQQVLDTRSELQQPPA
jgi:hypothetical protein